MFNGARSKRKYLWAWFVAGFALTILVLIKQFPLNTRATQLHDPPLADLAHYPLHHNHIVVASRFTQHFDVYLALVKTIRNVVGEHGDVKVYAETPLRFGFQDIVDRLDLYNGSFRYPDHLIASLYSSVMYESAPGAMVDLVVLGTCEVDMPLWSDQLLEVWDSRPKDKKFKLVCIVHYFMDTRWQSHIAAWSAREAIRLLPISQHVGKTFKAHFEELADSSEISEYTAGYEYIKIDTHVPVLNLPNLIDNPSREHPSLSRAAIQGNFIVDRRDYPGIFSDLIASLAEDSKSWGYLPLSDERSAYLPDADLLGEPFTLHLVGDGSLEIPDELSNVVAIHRGLSYTDYYALMQTMDIVIPAFVNRYYYDHQASSTIAMAIECNVPILATHRLRTSYAYLNDDRVTVTRPQGLREIAAVHALRSGQFVPPNGSPERLLLDVNKMLMQGWRRSSEDFSTFKRGLWQSNEDTVRRILSDF